MVTYHKPVFLKFSGACTSLHVWTVFHFLSSLSFVPLSPSSLSCPHFPLDPASCSYSRAAAMVFFTCWIPSSSCIPLTAGAFHWDWTNAFQWTWPTLPEVPRGLSTVLPDYSAKTLKLFLHWTDRILVLFISLVPVLGLACDEVPAANALLQPACLVNCWLKPPFWWQSKYNLIWTITG